MIVSGLLYLLIVFLICYAHRNWIGERRFRGISVGLFLVATLALIWYFHLIDFILALSGRR